MSWLVILLFAGFAQALLLSVLILCIKTGNRVANVFLASFLALMGLRLLLNFMVFSQVDFYALFYGAHILLMLSAPTLYLYVRALTEADFTFKPQLLLHGLVLLPIALLYLWRLYQVGAWTLLPGLEVISDNNIVMQVIGTSIFLSYGLMCLYRLSQHRALMEQAFSVLETVSLAWLYWLIQFYIGMKLMHLVLVLLGDYGFVAFVLRIWLLLISSLGIVYLISFFGLSQPLIFTQSLHAVMAQIKGAGDKASAESVALAGSESAAAANPGVSAEPRQPPASDHASAAIAEREKHKKAGLDDALMASIWAQLQALMRERQPYLDNTLNLAELAEMAEVKASHLSRVINSHAEANFYEFINGYRIDAAKQLLIEAGSAKVNLLDTAMAVGFNSQSTFYSHFKKHTGQTPKQFKDQNSR